MSGSPIDRIIDALDRLDVEAAVALFASDARLLTVDGRRAEGTDAVRVLLTGFLGQLRAASHTPTAVWHEENVWIAEVDTTYELQDFRKLTGVPRAFVLRDSANGIASLHVYGAHERRLDEHPSADRGLFIGDRWIPPL
jgi:hypothetical protein